MVSGFGVVFSDVDVANSSKLEFFVRAGRKIRPFAAPVRSDANGLSFVGVKFDAAIVARVPITSGNAPLGAQVKDITDHGTADLVVVDDFICGEPTPN